MPAAPASWRIGTFASRGWSKSSPRETATRRRFYHGSAGKAGLRTGVARRPQKWPSFEVVLAAKTGTEEGWQALVDYCRPLIVSRARDHGLRGPDVEDVQEVYAEVARNLREFRHDRPGAFRAWLGTIVEHKVADYFRRRSQQPRIETERGGRAGGDPIAVQPQ